MREVAATSSGRRCCSPAARTRRAAAPGREGVPARPVPVPDRARRHRPQLPRGDRVPRPARWPSWASGWSWPRCRRRSTPAGWPIPGYGPRATGCRPRRCSTPSPSTASTACIGGARRDEDKARAKERDLLVPRRLRPVGAAQPAARAVAPLQRSRPPRRARARLPDLRLDRARRVALHRAPSGLELPSHLLRPPARGRRARGHARGRRAVDAARPDEEPVGRDVRYRTVGDMTAPARCASEAAGPSRRSSPRSAASRITERGATRADDRFSETAMEDRKREGYF